MKTFVKIKPSLLYHGFIGSMTGTLISIFLSEKLIKFPQGTHEGGVNAAIGVGVIMITMFVVTFVGHWLMTRKSNRNVDDGKLF
jgi:hypothetical protein